MILYLYLSLSLYIYICIQYVYICISLSLSIYIYICIWADEEQSLRVWRTVGGLRPFSSLGLSYLRFQSLDFEQEHNNVVLKTSGDHLLI